MTPAVTHVGALDLDVARPPFARVPSRHDDAQAWLTEREIRLSEAWLEELSLDEIRDQIRFYLREPIGFTSSDTVVIISKVRLLPATAAEDVRSG